MARHLLHLDQHLLRRHRSWGTASTVVTSSSTTAASAAVPNKVSPRSPGQSTIDTHPPATDAAAKGLLAADHVDKWKTKCVEENPHVAGISSLPRSNPRYVTQSPASAAATPRPSTSRKRPKSSYEEYAEALEQDAPSPTVSLIRSRSHASSASGELSSVFGSVLSPGDNMRCVDCHVRFKQVSRDRRAGVLSDKLMNVGAGGDHLPPPGRQEGHGSQ